MARNSTLGRRFSKDPMATTKREWRKLPLPAKILVGAAALGAVGGATVATDISGRLGGLDIGGVVSKSATWGSNLAAKLKANG